MTRRLMLVLVVAFSAWSCGGDGTTQPSSTTRTISFFVTSTTSTTGNLGGLTGADATCRNLASGVGLAARTWRAYLSVEHDASNGNQPTNAKDRIGTGPWYNANLVLVANNVAELRARTGDAPCFSTSAAGASTDSGWAHLPRSSTTC